MGFGESFDAKGEVDQIMITFTPCGFLFGVFFFFFCHRCSVFGFVFA